MVPAHFAAAWMMSRELCQHGNQRLLHDVTLCRMVDAGEIFAEIDAAAGMVRFLEDPEQYTSSGALQRLNTTIQASLSLAEKLQAINTQVHPLVLHCLHASI